MLAGAASAVEGHRSDLVNRKVLRVCADPANLPFSNEKKEGFENKIADIIGNELGVPVEYTWFPQATGFTRNTLLAKRCDVIIGTGQGDDLVLNTNALYRSAYALIYKPGAGLDGVESIFDPKLKGKRGRRRAGHAVGQSRRQGRAHGQGASLSPDGRSALRRSVRRHGQGHPLRRDRCRRDVGADRGLLRVRATATSSPSCR